MGGNKFVVSQPGRWGSEGGGLETLLCPFFPGSDSAGELWEADTQDASSQALGGSNCTRREEASMAQSAGGTLGMGLKAGEPTALLPGMEALSETTGEECWVWRR